MQRDFQFFDNEIINYTHDGDTLTLFCVYGINEKWRTCFYHVRELTGADNLIGGVISFFSRDNSAGCYTLFFRNSRKTTTITTSDHWLRLQGWASEA